MKTGCIHVHDRLLGSAPPRTIARLWPVRGRTFCCPAHPNAVLGEAIGRVLHSRDEYSERGLRHASRFSWQVTPSFCSVPRKRPDRRHAQSTETLSAARSGVPPATLTRYVPETAPLAVSSAASNCRSAAAEVTVSGLIASLPPASDSSASSLGVRVRIASAAVLPRLRSVAAPERRPVAVSPKSRSAASSETALR